jgi:hypothetical protein
MRDRHNIVGSEVGRPRPPIYQSRMATIQKPRGSFRWGWLMLAVIIVLAIVCLSLILK